METIVKFSLIFYLLASAYAQPPIVYTPAPPTGTAVLHHPPPYVAAPHIAAPVAHIPVTPVAHVPVAHVAPIPVAHPGFVRILSQNYDLAPDGSYNFQYEAEDGSSRQEIGVPKFQQQPGVQPFGGLGVQGRYVYQSPEGPVEVTYIADENGFQPSGPGIHPAIVKAVAEQVNFARSEGPYPPHPAYRTGVVPLPAPFPSPVPSPLPPAFKQ